MNTRTNKSTLDELLRQPDVARIMGVSPATLRKWRYTGRGPRCAVQEPRYVRYLRSDVEAWLASKAKGGAR
jgi:predicted DNA-binding transcriptional regulator AlpA